MSNDDAYDLIVAIASGQLDQVDAIAAAFRPHLKTGGRG